MKLSSPAGLGRAGEWLVGMETQVYECTNSRMVSNRSYFDIKVKGQDF